MVRRNRRLHLPLVIRRVSGRSRWSASVTSGASSTPRRLFWRRGCFRVTRRRWQRTIDPTAGSAAAGRWGQQPVPARRVPRLGKFRHRSIVAHLIRIVVVAFILVFRLQVAGRTGKIVVGRDPLMRRASGRRRRWWKSCSRTQSDHHVLFNEKNIQ